MPNQFESLEPTPLIGGISQQEDSLRPETHVADMVNMVPDVRVGARVRPGTVFDRKFTMSPNADVLERFWPWAADESYHVILGRGGGSPILRIFRDGGNECSVTISADATTYLGLNSAGSANLHFCQFPEFGLIINSTVAAALTTTDSYTVERHRPTYRDTIAYSTTVNYYVQVDEDDAAADAGYYKYTPDTYTYSHINFPTITNPWSIHNGYWDDSGYYPCGFRIAFRRVALAGVALGTWDDTAKTFTKTGAFSSYTWRAGDMIYIDSVGTAGAGLVGWQRISAATADAVTLPDASAANGTANANVTAATYGETNICRIGRQIDVVVDFSKVSVESMHDIAAEFTKAMRSAGAENACCAWISQSSGGNFQITGPWRGNNSAVYLPSAITGWGAAFGASGDLTAANTPFNSTNAQFIAGTGGAAPDASDTATPESRWTRVAAPGQSSGKPSPLTMPLKVTRSSANNFSVDVGPWVSRTAGNSTTNPGPKLLTEGKKIRDAAWHQGRTVLIGSNYIDSSTAKDPWDLFIADPTQVVDSDPINKTVPGGGRGELKYALPWNDTLVLFHEIGQFELSSGTSPLTPTSATLSPSTNYPTAALRPQAGSSQLFFASLDSDNLRVNEYAYNDIRAASEASNVTGHVPELMNTSQRAMALVPINQTLIIMPSTGQTLYVYRWHYDGTEKLQSAWTTFEFDEEYRFVGMDSSNTHFWFLVENTGVHSVSSGNVTLTIASHGLSDGNSITLSESTTTPSVDGTKYVDVIDANTVNVYNDAGLTTPTNVTVGGTIRRNTGDFVLEKLSVSDTRTASGWAYAPCMDRQLTLTGSYSGGVTTFTLPNTPTVLTGSAQLNGLGSTLNKVVLGPDFGASSGQVLDIASYTTTEVKVTGNYTSGEVLIGRYFDWQLQLNKPFPRNGRGRPNIENRIAILGLTVRHQSSFDYTVQCVQTNAVTRTRPFSSTAAASGSHRTLLGGFSDASTYTIKNTSDDTAVKPAAIVAAQFEIDHTPFSETR